jgi:hypothetical protein
VSNGLPRAISCAITLAGEATICSSARCLYTDHGRLFHARTKLELFRDGSLLETEWNEYIERFYEPGDFSALLQAAGFTTIEVKQAIEKSMPEEPDRLVFVCKK